MSAKRQRSESDAVRATKRQKPLKTPVKIDGLQVIYGFVTPDQEEALLDEIDASERSNELSRRVQHYGYRYNYRKRQVTKDDYLGPLPEWSQLEFDETIVKEPFDQMIVNEYMPGQGIGAHVDCIPCFDDTVVSLSLGSHCVMRFTKVGESHEVYLPARSLVVLKGDARYKWKHEIQRRTEDPHPLKPERMLKRSRRVSITYRKVLL